MESCRPALLFLALALAVPSARAGDWPAFQNDAARSAATYETLALPMVRTWEYVPLQAPRPAWPEPGRELHRVDFDYTFHPIAADGMVFYASSADDSIHALDAATGRGLWHFTTGGPVRFAPAFDGGRLYAGSDDGFVYALDARTGAPVWRFRAAPAADQLIGNGRMISRWPLRAGVLVRDGNVYAAAGMWPTEGIHIYALDAAGGRVRWHNGSSGERYIDLPHPGASAFAGVAPQGALAASADTLFVPTGRSVPAAFDLATGALKYYRPATFRSDGGAWMTVADTFWINPSHGSGPDIDVELGESDPRPGDGLKAYRASDGMPAFTLENRQRALVHGGVLYAAGGGVVEAYDADALASGRSPGEARRWSAPFGRVYGMALAGDAVLCGGRGEIAAFDAKDGRRRWSDAVRGQVRGLAVADGRLLIATESGAMVCYENVGATIPETVLRQRASWAIESAGDSASTATDILRRSGCAEGYALVAGPDDARLATSLALQSRLRILALMPDEARAAAARAAILPTGLYGERLSFQAMPGPTAAALPFAPYFADLVVVSGSGRGRPGAEWMRLVRPCGGSLVLHGLPNAERDRILREADAAGGAITDGAWTVVRRGPLPGAGEWLHQWADAGRTGVGNDRRVKLPLRLLWFGGPGPERMMTRHWGTSTPLSKDGRVFVTGQNDLICYDAYNGRALWERAMEGVGRKHAAWRSSNFVADDRSLYTTTGAACFRIDMATGNIVDHYALPDLKIESAAVAEPPAPPAPSIEVEWPKEWIVFGPFPAAHTSVPEALLAAIPPRIEADGRTAEPQRMEAKEGALDLQFLLGGRTTSAEMARQVAYAFARLRVPEGGLLRIGAGADYWMQWHLDGRALHASEVTGYRRGIATHVFETPVTAGEHVLAVQVGAGSLGWKIVSAGGRSFDRFLTAAPPADGGSTVGPEAEWEFLSIAGDAILGTALPPRGTYGLGAALFAMNRDDGRLRWIVRARHGIPASAICADAVRVFYVDERVDPHRWNNPAKAADPNTLDRDLVAVDLRSGRELWRRAKVPPSGDASSCAQTRNGLVVANAGFACRADTGEVVWNRPIRMSRMPVLFGDWMLSQPAEWDMKTGEPRQTTDAVTGGERPWSFARAYGCGQIAGAPNLLFFRSGTFGFYDVGLDGTTSFSGARPNCSVSMIAAGGLMILPEGSAACACSYNFHTSLSLVPDEAAPKPWCVFAGTDASRPVRSLRVNFGAPGDRAAAAGTRWFAWPRPGMPGASQLPMLLTLDGVAFQSRSTMPGRATTEAGLAESDVTGRGEILVQVSPPDGVAAPTCAAPPVLDGDASDPSWDAAPSAEFQIFGRLTPPREELRFLRDQARLYVSYRESPPPDGSTRPFAVTQKDAGDVSFPMDDRIEILVTDAERHAVLLFGVSPGNARYDARAAPEKLPDLGWNSGWDCTVQAATGGAWCAEMAIPLETLRASGLDAAALRVNALVRRGTPAGDEQFYLAYPCDRSFADASRTLPLRSAAAPVQERNYRVRLHLRPPATGSSPVEIAAGDQRRFVAPAAADASVRVVEFASVAAGRSLSIRLSSPPGAPPPTLCAMEVTSTP